MKAITFSQACHLLNESSAVCIDGELTRAYINDSNVEFFWTNDNGMDHYFGLQDTDVVDFDGTTIHAGGYEITLLVPMKKNVDKL